MTETKLLKLAVRQFILDKIREATIFEFVDLAAKYDLSAFRVAECFDNELWRVDKFLGYPDLETLYDFYNPHNQPLSKIDEIE
jgi:hypothetical protein